MMFWKGRRNMITQPRLLCRHQHQTDGRLALLKTAQHRNNDASTRMNIETHRTSKKRVQNDAWSVNIYRSFGCGVRSNGRTFRTSTKSGIASKFQHFEMHPDLGNNSRYPRVSKINSLDLAQCTTAHYWNTLKSWVGPHVWGLCLHTFNLKNGIIANNC